MIVVHLPGVRNDRNRVGFCECTNFVRLRDSAYAIGIELDVIDSTLVEEFTKSVNGKFVLAARDWNSSIGLQFRVAADIVGNDRLFQPAQVKRFQQREHALGIVKRPAHVRVGHHVDLVAHGFTDGA